MAVELRNRGGNSGEKWLPSSLRAHGVLPLPLAMTTTTHGRHLRGFCSQATRRVFFLCLLSTILVSLVSFVKVRTQARQLLNITMSDTEGSIVPMLESNERSKTQNTLVNVENGGAKIEWIAQPRLSAVAEAVVRLRSLSQVTNLETLRVQKSKNPKDDSSEVLANRIAKADEGNSNMSRLTRCPDKYETPVPERHQRCCEMTPNSLTCLPNLVILGAQKAGSTALHSYLLFHPNLVPGKKKEFHVFDFDRNYLDLGTKFKSLVPSLPIGNRSSSDVSITRSRITFEASPSYIADVRACPRMARFLSRDARFVLLLRDPVERLWSEVLMKKRRVEVQTEFLEDILPQYSREVFQCIQDHMFQTGGDDRGNSGLRHGTLKALKECVPLEIARHGRFNSFFKYLQAGTPHAVKFVNECLARGRDVVLECVRGSEFRNKILVEKMPDFFRIIYSEAEVLKDLMDQGCCSMTPNVPIKRSNPLVLNNETPSSRTLSLGQAKSRLMNPLSMSECRGCGCRCFPRAGMMSDISKNFVWRSLFLPQVVHCLQSLDRERLLILDMRDLQKDPAGTLSKVFKHAGVPDLNMSTITYENARELFNSHYPDFEQVSGWSHSLKRGEGSIPDELKMFLTEFYRPFNRQLFSTLGIPPFEGWAI